jgi:RNA polymerase sigma factor (TIGR02999 family)
VSLWFILIGFLIILAAIRMIETARITTLLQDAHAGREGAMDELMSVVYSDLERVAHRHMHERFGQGMRRLTLEPAGLVNESFLRLLRQKQGFENRQQFFAIATRIMLRVLIDYCRQRAAAKRGGGGAARESLDRITITFDDTLTSTDPSNRAAGGAGSGEVDVDALSAALDALEALDPRKADVVRMRVVWGLPHEAIAEALAISVPTVERDWRFARAWLANAVVSRDGNAADVPPLS